MLEPLEPIYVILWGTIMVCGFIVGILSIRIGLIRKEGEQEEC